MKQHRFYEPALLQGEWTQGQTHALSEASLSHIKSLRIRDGEPIVLFHGQGGCFQAVFDKPRKQAVLGAFSADPVPVGAKTSLAVALAPSQTLSAVIQKAVECGVDQLMLLDCDYAKSSGKHRWDEKKSQRYQQIIIQACQQCGRNQLPRWHGLQSVENLQAMPLWQHSQAVVCHPGASMISAQDRSWLEGDICWLIGPEGGWSEAELKQWQRVDWPIRAVADSVLRMETACLQALAIHQVYQRMISVF